MLTVVAAVGAEAPHAVTDGSSGAAIQRVSNRPSIDVSRGPINPLALQTWLFRAFARGAGMVGWGANGPVRSPSHWRHSRR
jgi:hypothetical protein